MNDAPCDSATSQATAGNSRRGLLTRSGSRPLFRELPTHAWEVVEAQVEEFEAAWERGERPCKENYLVLPDPTDGQLLVELVFVEMERRLRCGETVNADSYLAQHPELARSSEIRDALHSLEHEFASTSAGETVTGSTIDDHVSRNHFRCESDSRLKTDYPPAVAQVAHFDLLEQLGSGGFGVVWKARDRRLDRIVAIKIPHAHRFDADRRAILLREARAAACLSHPGVVSIHEVSVIGAEAFLVYEYIEGTSLSAWLSQNRFSYRDAASACLDLARAVCHAHERGIVHRDLKPSNILIDSNGVLRITDFGLSKRRASSSDATRDGLVMGSVPYMSPEQAAGNARAADARADIYSLGVIFYELLTGATPFRADDPDVLFKILHQQPQKPKTIDRNVPDELQAICLQAMAKRVDDRYATASAMADDLASFLAGERVFAYRRRIGRTIRRLRSHSKALISAAIVAPLVIALFSAATSVPHGEVADAKVRAQVRSSSSPTVARAPDPNQIAHPAFHPRPVEIRTTPSGAEVWVFPRDRLTGAVRPYDRIAGSAYDRRFAPASFELSPGDYLIVAELADGRFTAINHHIPLRSEPYPTLQSSLDWHRDRRNEDGIWIDVGIPVAQHLEGMVLVPAGDLTVQSGDHEVRLTFPPFYLGSDKLGYGAYRSFRVQGGAVVPDAVPDYLEDRSLSDADVMLLTYADAETLFAHAGFRLAEQAELAYAASLNGYVHGLESGPDELTGTLYAPSPWTVGDQIRGLQYEMQRLASPERILPLVRQHLVFEAQPVERRNPMTLGTDQPDVRFVGFRETTSPFAVRAARHARAPRDEIDFIRFQQIDR